MRTRGRREETHALIERLGVIVESRAVRTVLVVLIIVSVLPFQEVERALRWVFVAAFGAELLVRVPLLVRRRRRGATGMGELAFLVIDFAAFLSFIPLEQWFHQHFEWLVFMRLSRLLVLLRFAKELAADLYQILTRREQLQQFGLVTVAVGALAFVSAVILSQLGVRYDYDGVTGEQDSFLDQLWWSFRQLESADNLVPNLHGHALLTVLSLALTITGVFIISFVIGIGTNVVEQVVKAERRRRVGYRGHTIVIGPIDKSEVLVREFVRIYTKNRRDVRDQLMKLGRWFVAGGSTPRAWSLPRMALLGPAPEPPAVLYEPGMRWVVYREGEGGEREALHRIGAGEAKRAILLGDRSAGPDADAITVATLSALREINPEAHVFIELLASRNFSTLRTLGEGTRTFLLDVPRFIGLFLLHHLVIPGVERLYHYLLTADGSELYSHVYLETSEIEDLAELADDDGYVSSALVAEVAAEQETVLVGVFLGDVEPSAGTHDLIPTDGLVIWVNPHEAPTDPRLIAMGARAGRIPADKIRGVIAVGETYQPVRSFARELAHRPGDLRAETGGPSVHVVEPTRAPRRILIVGYGDAIVSFTHRLTHLVDDARVVVAFDGHAPALRRLTAALARDGATLEPDGRSRYRAELERGGRLELRRDRGDAMDAALSALSGDEPVEAVVFLSEDDAVDPDARTALRMMRLAERLLDDESDPPHILAEFGSLAKGERLRMQVELAFARVDRAPPRLTLVSTEQVRNYFMVHSAFVPGINEVYSQLLGERGQDLIRVPVEADGPLSMRAIRAQLLPQRRIPLGLELADGTVALNPPDAKRFDQVTAVFAVGGDGSAAAAADEEE